MSESSSTGGLGLAVPLPFTLICALADCGSGSASGLESYSPLARRSISPLLVSSLTSDALSSSDAADLPTLFIYRLAAGLPKAIKLLAIIAAVMVCISISVKAMPQFTPAKRGNGFTMGRMGNA